MEYILICLVAILASFLTLFSGFGLGTLLMPVFGLFFPIEIAIAMTAIVHFLNNIFKLLLFKSAVNWNLVLKFGIPSLVAAFIGAMVLNTLVELKPLTSYQFLSHSFYISPVKLSIALLLIFFSLWELIPKLSKIQFDKKFLVLGGILSGFFGGLSGNQGALRSAFLIRLQLQKDAFIATGVVIACMVDISRLTIYSGNFLHIHQYLNIPLLCLATLAAFLGVFIGNRLLKKVTINFLQITVALFLLLFSVLLGIGVI